MAGGTINKSSCCCAAKIREIALLAKIKPMDMDY
jgi:hypothetical protein